MVRLQAKPHTGGSENSVEVEVEDCKKYWIWEFVVRLCLLTMSDSTPRKSQQNDCLHVS